MKRDNRGMSLLREGPETRMTVKCAGCKWLKLFDAGAESGLCGHPDEWKNKIVAVYMDRECQKRDGAENSALLEEKRRKPCGTQRRPRVHGWR